LKHNFFLGQQIMAKTRKRTKVFVSYSHFDQEWLARLQVHLKPLERSGLVDRWDDTRIAAGQKWKIEIRKAIDSAAVAILLISADFLASDFINEDELPPLLRAAESEGTVILPLVISPCRFSQTKGLSQFQAVNPPSQPLIKMDKADREQTFVDLVNRVEQLLKECGKVFGNHFIVEPYKRKKAVKDALASFHPDFPSHGIEATTLVDYLEWHESDSDWGAGNGLLTTATYGELPHLWTRVDRFAPYEARLLHFIRNGGTVRRVFLIRHELHNDSTRFMLYRTLKRHIALNFNPHVCSHLAVQKAADTIGIHCDTLGFFNGRIAYFLQSHEDTVPTMVRSVDQVVLRNTGNILQNLWNQSEPASNLFKRRRFDVPKAISLEIERDIETVEEIARENV